MRTLLLLLVPILVLSSSCKKDKSSVVDRMTFYTGYGFRTGPDVVMYQVDKKSLLKDDNAKQTEGYIFRPTHVMPKEKYDIARVLLERLPKEMLTVDGKRYGSPGSHDQQGYIVIIEKDGKARRFDIDQDNTADQSKDILAFKQNLADVMKQLQ